MLPVAVIVGYLLWASGESGMWVRAWHLASALPLAGALLRFDRLTGAMTAKPVEDLLVRDPAMLGLELCWLLTFLTGLA